MRVNNFEKILIWQICTEETTQNGEIWNLKASFLVVQSRELKDQKVAFRSECPPVRNYHHQYRYR